MTLTILDPRSGQKVTLWVRGHPSGSAAYPRDESPPIRGSPPGSRDETISTR